MSLGTSEPLIVYAPRGGGKTFYRRFAAQQIRYHSEHSTYRGIVAIEIEDLGEKLSAEPELSGETIARLIYHVLCTELKVSKSPRGPEHIGAILQKCDEAIRAAGRPMAYVLVDDVRQLFSTNAADAEKNQRALAALVEFLRQAAGRSAGKPLALRVFLPLALQRAIDERRLQEDRWPRQRVITWRPRRCQAVAVRRLDTCGTNKKADMAAGLGRLFTTEALTEFERWLDELPFVSPRCVIWTLNRLALYACSAGVTTELLGAELWQQFIEQAEWQRDCHPEPEYPFNVQYNLQGIRKFLLDAFSVKELQRFLPFASHPDLVKLLDELGLHDSQSEIVDKTIAYCSRRGLMAELLREVKRARPRKYARYEEIWLASSELERWLASRGLRGNPFGRRSADQDQELPKYFVDIGGFDEMLRAQGPCFVFAGRGCGKTAQRQMLAAQCRPADRTSTRLAIPYTHASFGPLLDKANDALDDLEPMDHVATLLTTAIKIVTEMQATGPRLLHSPTVAATVSKELSELESHLAPHLHRERGGAGAHNGGLTALDALEKFAALVQVFGIKTCVVLVEGLDESLKTAGRPVQTAAFLAPLLGTPPLIECPGWAFKFYLPWELKPVLYNCPWFHAERLQSLSASSWDENLLSQLLRERLIHHSLRQPPYEDLAQLCEDDLAPVIDIELVSLADSPRAALYLSNALLQAHAAQAPPPERIAADTWERVKEWWRTRRTDFDAVVHRVELYTLAPDESRIATSERAREEEYKKRSGEASQLLADGDLVSARSKFAALIDEFPIYADRWREELGFVFDFSQDEEFDAQKWERNRGQIEWRRKVWTVLSIPEYAKASGDKKRPDGEMPGESVSPTPPPSPLPLPSSPPPLGLSPEKQGERLEQDTVQLLRHLFQQDPEGEKRILQELAPQRRGTQFGFDVRLSYRLEDTDHIVRCYLECKSQFEAITSRDISSKVQEAKAFSPPIDHWILVAPRAHISNSLYRLVNEWEEQSLASFRIQLWTRDTEIWQLFGLLPELYKTWITPPPGEEDPSLWSEDKKEVIRKEWIRKLDPPLRLPKGWAEYVRDPRKLCISTDAPAQHLDALGQSHLEPRGIDEAGVPLPEPLIDYVRSWLDTEKRVFLLLGDFGDGKTVFTYLLSLRLLTEFRANPHLGWLPVRFSLKEFSRPAIRSGDTFLKTRINRISELPDWHEVVKNYQVLVILDGIDEMSRELDAASIRGLIDTLVDCCNEQFRGEKLKILLTCRTPFFRSLNQRKYLLERLDSPLTVFMRSADHTEVYENLLNQAASLEHIRRVEALRHMHDPIGLAIKPLFYGMISETLQQKDADYSSATGLYNYYARETLLRKKELLEARDQGIPDSEVVDNLLEILEEIALSIHRDQKEYADLKKLIGNNKKRRSFAHMLWDMVSTSPRDEEDAQAQVAFRSLLRQVEAPDAGDAWPVDFCHRSMREYFVARGITRCIIEAPRQARSILVCNDLSHEIIGFVAELIRGAGAPGDHLRNLRGFAENSRPGSELNLSEKERRHLGRNSISLLCRAAGKLPDVDDWSNMLLDGADLSGIDLSGKCFRGTSLRNANLDNAVLNNSNFVDADLTGVRLEETSEVRSLSVPPSQDGVFAGYADGTIWRWSFSSSGQEPRSVLKTEARSGLRLETIALPGNGLCVLTGNRLTFADSTESEYKQLSALTLRPGISRVLLKRDVALILQPTGDRCLASLIDFTSGEPSARVCNLRDDWLCDVLGKDFVVEARADGTVVVLFLDSDAEYPITPEPIPQPSALAVSEPLYCLPHAYYVACGTQMGMVYVWRVTLDNDPPAVQEALCQPIHKGAVTALAFVGSQALLSGGNDRRICWIDLGDPSHLPTVSRTFQLKLQCKGMEIDGLKSEREYAILQSLRSACEIQYL
jgi:hypothetical protein